VGAGSDLELVLTHEFDAPRALVFRAWTQQQHAAQWWGPQGFTTVSCRMDARPGGAYRLAMRGPDGVVRTKRGVYREVTPDRIVFSYAWEDADGNPGHEMRVTITLEEIGTRTRMTLHQTGFEAIPERDSHRSGWTSCMRRLAEFLEAQL
jgi:uncharacterized protein YndB with AHSA1/START domain